MRSTSMDSGRGRSRILVALAIVAVPAISACRHSPTSPTTTATAALSGVSLSAGAVAGGLPVTGTITLSAAAPADGATVALTSSRDAALVPASVTVPAGATSQTFDIQTAVSAEPATATITATYLGVAKTATLTIAKLALQSLSPAATSATGGSRIPCTVTLVAPAPDGGVQVSLTSSSPAVIVPASVAIDAGATEQTFSIVTVDSPAPVVATITATLPYSGSTRSTTLTVGRVALQSLWLGIDALPGGLSITGTVTLSVATPVDALVALSSSSPAATVPSSVIVPAGETSQTFEIATVNAPPTRTVTITAAYGGAAQRATLTVIAYPTIAGVHCSSVTPVGGTAIECTGTLASPAPADGWQLSINTSDESVTASPASVTVSPSSQTFQFEIATMAVTTSTVAIVRIAVVPSGLLLFSQALTVTPS